MPFVNVADQNIYYEPDCFVEPWAAPPEVILIEHGIARNSAFWLRWIPALASKYRVIRRDMRGHGQSSAPDASKWSSRDLVEDVRGFMDALGLEQVHYLGESTGGRVGGLFASIYGERLRSLALCSVPFKTRGSTGPRLTSGS